MPDAEKRRIRNAGDVRRAKPGTKTLVSGVAGLYLIADHPNNLHPEGLKRWMYRYRKLSDGNYTEISIGHWPHVDLDKAKLAAYDHRHKLRYQNADPQDVKKISQGQRNTFQEAAQEYLRINGPNKGDRWKRQFKLFTVNYGEQLSRQGVGNILREQVREAIAPVFARTWRQGRETLNLWEDIFSLAQTRVWRLIENPAQWEIHKHNFPRPSGLKLEHHPSLHYSTMPEFLQTLRPYQAHHVPAIAIEFVILTALRSNKEARLIQWTEVNFDNQLLSIPGERMKKRKHREEGVFQVPLSDRAIALLLMLKQRAKGPFVFSVRSPNKPMTESAMIKFLRDTMKIPADKADMHGFRATFVTWCKEMNNFDYEARKRCLDHVVGDQTEQAYDRAMMLEKRREIMNAWADYCDQKISL